MKLTSLIARRFSSAELEKTFLIEYGQAFLPQRRVATHMALFVWSAFFFWDWAQSNAFSQTAFLYLIAIRAVVILLLAWVLHICWKPAFAIDEYATAWMISTVGVAWIGLLGMMLVAPPNNTFREYYPGLLLVYYFLLTFLRIRARIAAISGLIFFVLYNIAELILNLNGEYRAAFGISAWFSSSFFLICFYITGTMIATQLEISFRRDFLDRRALREARANAGAATSLLQRQNEKMQDLVLEKERFFSSAYHDIQQPLAVISLYVRSARKKLLEIDPSVDNDLSVIESNAIDMVNLFKGIHDYSELGAYNPAIQAVNPGEVIEEIICQYKAMAEEKGISLKYSARQRRPPYINTDRPLFKRLIANLISNAIKYTPRGGVLIGWVRLPNTLRIDVWDSGIGIPEEHREKIFSEYYQINNPGRDRNQGIGLGLSIVQKIESILPRHRLRFSSVEGRGSRFSIYVPIVPGRQAEEFPANDRDTPVDLAGKYIVVCDDEPALLRGLTQLFMSVGALVDGVGSLSDTHRLLDSIEREPDVVITDMRLRGGDTGIQVAEAFRSHWDVLTPVAFITGELITPSSSGMNGFQRPFAIIQKSSDPEQIVSQVQALLNSGSQ